MEMFIASKVWCFYGADHNDDDNRPVHPTSVPYIYRENGRKNVAL